MNRAGTYISNMTGEARYESFRPSPLPPDPPIELDAATTELLVGASRELARLNAIADLIPCASLFISMYVRKEALLSSQIEGTQCTLEDVLDPSIDTNANLDVADVVNYVNAANYALDRMHELPLCNRLLRETHERLMSGVRGQEKYPGEFRRSQNWIGPAGCTLKDARFIPPNPDDMRKAMASLERYINEDRAFDTLVRAALIHYQFETIHPFLDGNGRIGRLLILLYLMQQGLLGSPVLYVSYFLKKNQVEYYDRISEVRRSGNYEQWVRFFLEAVQAAAKDAGDSIGELARLHDSNLAALSGAGRVSENTRRLFDYLEEHPIITIGAAAHDLDVSYNTASASVRRLMELGVLRETTNAARNRVFAYQDYIDVLRRDT